MVLVSRRRPLWELDAPEVRPWGDGTRVVCRGTHGTLSFRCTDRALQPSTEAFAGLLLLPALRARARLVVTAPLDRRWMEGMHRLVERWRRWWGGGPFPIEAPVGDARASEGSRGHGLCFTAGVDSYYTLLGAPERWSHLLYVHGFDIPLSDGDRMDALRPSLEATSERLGKSLIVLDSDARENDVFRRESWERTHGAALAAAGHLLSGDLERLTFGPSWIWGDLRPWGTHPETDAWWSSSGLEVEPGPATLNRDARLRQIAEHPLVHDHLHVCWEHRTDQANCGRCEKCVRTMVVLAGLGVLDRCRTFDASIDLPAAVDALSAFPPGYDLVWGDMLALDLDGPLRLAVQRLIRRSG